MSIIIPANSAVSGGFSVANSLMFNSVDSPRLTRSGATPTSAQKATMSFWIKRSSSGSAQVIVDWFEDSINFTRLAFESDDVLKFSSKDGNNVYGQLTTNRKFRDTSAWYNIIVAIDTTQGTASNRMKMYINGVQETSFSTETQPAQNRNFKFDAGKTVGANGGIGEFFNGYMSEGVYADGTQNAQTDFGEFEEDSGIWQPIDVSGLTFGNNGFYLDFEDSSALGNDAAGSNNFTVNNLTAIDQSLDTCTNNFATWNPLFRKGTTTPAFTEGNLKSTFDDTGANEFALTTFGVSAGKWYAEVKWTANTGTAATATGILDMAYTGTADPNDAVTNAFGYFGSGTKNVSGTASSYGNSYADGNIVGIAIDMDNNKLYFSKNGTFQNSGDPTTGATGTGAIAIVAGVTYGIFATDYNNQVAELNTGSPAYAISSGNQDGDGFGNFEYAVPSGYFALCTKNLAEYG